MTAPLLGVKGSWRELAFVVPGRMGFRKIVDWCEATVYCIICYGKEKERISSSGRVKSMERREGYTDKY